MIFEGFKKIQGIMKVKKLGLPTPETIFVEDINIQSNQVNNFLMDKELVMIRSEKEDQSMNCPRNLQCKKSEVKEFIKDLNDKGYVAILQEYVPLNNKYSGNILMLKDSFIIEVMKGGPVSKLNREGKVDEHLRINRNGEVTFHHGEQVIPNEDVKKIINTVKDLPLNYHILEFSTGPDWMYYWHTREDLTSKKLE